MAAAGVSASAQENGRLSLLFWIVDSVLLYLGARHFRGSELAVGMVCCPACISHRLC